MLHHRSAAFLLLASLLPAAPAVAAVYHFSTGGPDNQMAAVSQPSTAGVEAEAADDFVLDQPTAITHATFTGLFAGGTAPPTVSDVTVEIYRVFPQDSTSPPSGNVPTRVSSPSDVAFASRDSAASALTFTTSVLSPTFTALNSVQSGGIHPVPNQTTGGNGPLTGQEVAFDVTFTAPFVLPAGHYFFVPQVGLTAGATFYWLSAPKPITGAGSTPFAADLQSWIRDANLAPDWLRIGTDVVGGGTPPAFNATFTLDGIAADPVPTLSTFGFLALALGLAAVALLRLRS
jgi:hypothetical protein